MKNIVIYWSGTGNTKSIAQRIAKDTNSDIKEVYEASVDLALEYDNIILGCPAMGSEELEDDFKVFSDDLLKKANNKKIFLFGSYGWGDGEWMRNWEEEVNKQSNLGCDGLIVCGDESDIDEELYQSFISSIN